MFVDIKGCTWSPIINNIKNVIICCLWLSYKQYTMPETQRQKHMECRKHEDVKILTEKNMVTSSISCSSDSLCFWPGWCFRNWATYVIIDFSSGLSTSTSAEEKQIKVTKMQLSAATAFCHWGELCGIKKRDFITAFIVLFGGSTILDLMA